GLLWALLFTVGGAEAAGLGKLSVQSALGQPLRAEIELLSVNKDELPNINAGLAGADAFRQAHIERTAALAALRFSVEQRANGQPVIRINSNVPIADPFLDLLIEVNWTSGRLLREYTILLDPPPEARPAMVQPAAVPVPVRPPQTATLTQAVERKAVVEKPAAQTAESGTTKQAQRYGPIKSGETLRGIAARVKPENVTLEQMMVSLYRANQGAFLDNNMNRLKRGRVLNVPDAEAVHLQVSPSQALREVRGHAAEWHAYRSRVAEMAGDVPETRLPEAAAGKIAPKKEETAPTAAAPRDMLKLSKGEPAAGRVDGKTLEKLQTLEEELAAKGRALQEAQERVDQLERTVRDMQKLLELKSQAGAKPLPAQPAPEEPAPVVEAPAPAAPVVPVAPPPPPMVKPAPAQVPVELPEPARESGTSWISTFISNPLYIGGIVAAVLLSVLLWMMMVGSRRRQGLNKFEDSIMTGGEFKNNAVFNATPPATGPAAGANTEGSMLLTDFSRLGLGAIDTHEVDPIAEAEVYMAYGRDAQAEEILKEALGKDPSRHEIALKLLEIYAARKDTQVFETVASELYASLGGVGPVWQRAAEMGRTIDAANPLYRASASEIAAAQPYAAKPKLNEQLAASAAVAAAASPAAVAAAAPMPPITKQEAFSASLPEEDYSLEFEPAQPPATSVDDTLRWQPPLPDVQAPAVAQPEPKLAEPGPDRFDTAPSWETQDADLEFDHSPMFEHKADAQGRQEETPEEAMPVLDLSNIDLELEAEQPSPFAEDATVVMPDMETLELEPKTPADEFVPDLAEALAPSVEPEMAEFAPTESFDLEPVELSEIDLGQITAETLQTETIEYPEITFEPVTPPAAAVESMPLDALERAPEPAVMPESADETVVMTETLTAPEAETAEMAESELLEEVNTKLDLARAYLEMGDQEGAREILQEVLGEGNPQQKAEADKLLADLA
ncbi:MAG: FimV/HubP family polar landmark protein, partial [Planctomycetota bacterium]